MKLSPFVLVALIAVAPWVAADTTHVVQAGETLYSIARSYGVAVADLMRDNGITDATRVRVGARLVVKGGEAAASPGATVEYVVQKDDTFWSISRRYQLTVAELAALNPGVTPTKLRVGARLRVPADTASAPTGTTTPTESQATHTAAQATQGTSPATPAVPSTQQGGQGPRATNVTAPAAGAALPSALPAVLEPEGELWPHPGPRTEVRDRHFQHISIAAKAGDPVLAVASGFVRWVSPFSTYANIVIIETRDGVYQFWYAGVDDVYVRTGEWVKKGATIARVATSGIDAKPRVAFGVYRGLTPIDHTRMIWQ